jgi:hypothetical protein
MAGKKRKLLIKYIAKKIKQNNSSWRDDLAYKVKNLEEEKGESAYSRLIKKILSTKIIDNYQDRYRREDHELNLERDIEEDIRCLI